MTMTLQFVDMTSSSDFLDVVLFLWSSLVTDPILCQNHHWFWSFDNFFCKGLTRNAEIRNTPVEVLSNIWRLEQVREVSLVVSDLRSETKASQFESSCQLGTEVSSLQ